MTVLDYTSFLESKRLTVSASGYEVNDSDINPILFPFQRDLVRWAIRKGRAAIFADTGLGKTLMQVEWARLTGVPTLIIAPLSIARQTVTMARDMLGIDIVYSRDGSVHPLTITNYEMIDRFHPSAFGAVVLDESSILKALDGKTRTRLTEMFKAILYRLCCTATPAPNDITEIGNHAEFLGIMTNAEMLSAFFVHDADESRHGGWRLKGHAEDAFYRWLASWGMSVRKPSDLGYSDDGYNLPSMTIEPLWIKADWKPDGQLFHMGLHGIQERHSVRKATLDQRIDAAIDLVNSKPGPWILWCGLNDEANALAERLDNCLNVQGSDDPDRKAEALEAFQRGDYRVLITKPRIAGFGMNFQHCKQMAFVGLSDSWEAYYQCIRRSWRFGQTDPVHAYIVLSDAEEDIYHNVMHKEKEASVMRERLIEHVANYEREEIEGIGTSWEYETDERSGDNWRLMLGDSCERMGEVETASVDLSVFSPPFLSLYTYSPTERDVGNSQNDEQFWYQFGIIIDELMRVTKPGRLCAVHCQQVPLTKVHDGVIGIKDFRGDIIRRFSDQGWIFHGEVCIDKDPQAQAIRTKNKGLLFVQLEKDSSWLRPAFGDYICVFRRPGENEVQIKGDLSRDEWITWAHPVWYHIRESDTLNAAEGREEKDEKHVAPLQLETIERCVRLWSNPGETVLSPFAGIGSEGYVSVKHGRRFIGIELKPSYFRAAVKNLGKAEESVTRRLL
jgi:DNA modification methylase/superfamily II DNA or RNA helicase